MFVRLLKLFYRHAFVYASYFRFINIASEIRSFMLATVAIVVPSLNVLLIMTELPAFTGTSKINPSIVDRIRVLLNEALF